MSNKYVGTKYKSLFDKFSRTEKFVIMKVRKCQFKTPADHSKELEIINFRALQEDSLENTLPDCNVNLNNWMLEYGTVKDQLNETQNQFTSFQKSMKFLIIVGQVIGLNPVIYILDMDISKIRFNYYSVKFVYTLILGIIQISITVLCVRRIFRNAITIGSLGYLSFYLAASITTLTFVRIAKKWPTLLKELKNSRLCEYVDPKVVSKCNWTCFSFLAAAAVEHTLSILSRVVRIIECQPEVTDVFTEFTSRLSPWLLGFNIPFTKAFGIFVLVMNVVATINWNYSDMFIVCISLYLTSILEQINKKIIQASNKNILPSSVWASLREDYTQATRLVRLFDDMFSIIVLISLASNLFFMCLQLFNILVVGINSKEAFLKECPNFACCGPLKGYEYTVYLVYSTLYIMTRFLIVCLVAANVHTASLEPAPALYQIPTCAYSREVQRFLEQVHGSVVALSGLQFFYITKELILSVAGTIITYELVLLQFNDDEIKAK